MAKRIQRKRDKGWQMPPNTIYVGRPTRWGNPFRVDQYGSEAVMLHRRWMMGKIPEDELAKLNDAQVFGPGDPIAFHKSGGLAALRHSLHPHELRGKDLACWCAEGQPCHADILLELANQ